MKKGLVWLRRDLRLHDHKPLSEASKECDLIYLCFVFDKEILSRFDNKKDRRISFIADALQHMHKLLDKNTNIYILYGDPKQLIPNLAKELGVFKVYAGEDHEQSNIERDRVVKNNLEKIDIELSLSWDHILIAPNIILKNNKEPYRVFTPYYKAWQKNISSETWQIYKLDKNKIKYHNLQNSNLKLLPLDVKNMLSAMDYEYQSADWWNPEAAQQHLYEFEKRINNYKHDRDFLALDGISKLSPYLRFGILSIRECYRMAHDYDSHGALTWISELAWREFYIMIMFYYPHSVNEEFQEQYRGKINWSQSENNFKAWCEGKTGYPVVDAAMRQLVKDGWMHNRARMIVAAFLTKSLMIDWRKGEEFFAQYLMDYELSSNVGGWQWSASTGTDAQPYFRIFNPYLQSEKFDQNGEYIKKYVEELKYCDTKHIHKPTKQIIDYYKYYPPIVDHYEQREKAIAIFKKLKND